MRRERICECCGKAFKPKEGSTARRCPGCQWKRLPDKKPGGAVSDSDTGKGAKQRKKSSLNENVARAAEFGISYGKYMQIKDYPWLLEKARRAAQPPKHINRRDSFISYLIEE